MTSPPAADTRVAYAELGEVTLAWEEHGSGPRPLVLVHGLTGSRDDWADVLPALSALTHVVLFDQRGHGASSNLGREDAYSLNRLVTDLEQFLALTGIEQCDLLGHSLGGAVALAYTIAHPERVASLILMDTARRMPESLRAELALTATAVRAHGLAWLVSQTAATPLTGEAVTIAARIGEAQYRLRLERQLAAVDPAALLGLSGAVLAGDVTVDRLTDIRCPTTVIVGADDEPFLDPADDLRRQISGAVQVVIDGAGHSPQKAAPEAWLHAVAQHLQRTRG